MDQKARKQRKVGRSPPSLSKRRGRSRKEKGGDHHLARCHDKVRNKISIPIRSEPHSARILTAPYEDSNGGVWDLNVMDVDGTLYLEEHTNDAKLAEKYAFNGIDNPGLNSMEQGRHGSSSSTTNVLWIRF